MNMQHWPWWLGGMALAGVAVVHWFLLRKMLAVSGGVTALVDRLFHASTQRVEGKSLGAVAAQLAFFGGLWLAGQPRRCSQAPGYR
jgi:hypothetical protein